jgi:hypothetical protein
VYTGLGCSSRRVIGISRRRPPSLVQFNSSLAAAVTAPVAAAVLLPEKQPPKRPPSPLRRSFPIYPLSLLGGLEVGEHGAGVGHLEGVGARVLHHRPALRAAQGTGAAATSRWRE